MIETLVKKEDYLQMFGLDLDLELSSRLVNDIGDSPAPRFISQIENWCKDYLLLNYAWDGILQNENQTERFKKGVLQQIDYILQNAEFNNESGYSSATNTIIPKYQIEQIEMSPKAIIQFRLAGLMNWGRC